MSRFCELSLRLLLGDAVAPALEQGRVVAAQCISGTGGLHLAAKMIHELINSDQPLELYLLNSEFGFRRQSLAPIIIPSSGTTSFLFQ